MFWLESSSYMALEMMDPNPKKNKKSKRKLTATKREKNKVIRYAALAQVFAKVLTLLVV